jgi:hypothetical protein
MKEEKEQSQSSNQFNVQSEQDNDKMLPVNCIPTDKDISKHFEQTVKA